VLYVLTMWQFFPDPDRDPERTPGSRFSYADRHQNVISWSLGYIPAVHKISSKSVGKFFDNLVNTDFGLLDPDGDLDRHQNVSPWSLGHALPLQEILSKSIHSFFSYPMDRQTDRSKNINLRRR